MSRVSVYYSLNTCSVFTVIVGSISVSMNRLYKLITIGKSLQCPAVFFQIPSLNSVTFRNIYSVVVMHYKIYLTPSFFPRLPNVMIFFMKFVVTITLPVHRYLHSYLYCKQYEQSLL